MAPVQKNPPARPVARLVAIVVVAASLIATGVVCATLKETFSGERAFQHVKAQVDIGVRSSGSPGAEKCRAYIRQQLEAAGFQVEMQEFKGGMVGAEETLTNVVGRRQGKSPGRIVVGAHYDTKRIKEFKFIGANDGGSGVAVLLELARVMGKGPGAGRTLDLVFFDGEEALATEPSGVGLYGSTHYVQQLAKGGRPDIAAAIIVDMVGDKQLSFHHDENSTPWLWDLAKYEAAQLGYSGYFNGRRLSVIDDHIPFLQHNVPALDLIDFSFGEGPNDNRYWHTDQDTLDKISPESLKVTGQVVHAMVLRLLDAK